MKFGFPVFAVIALLFISSCSAIGGDFKDLPAHKLSKNTDTSAPVIEVTSISAFQNIERSLIVDGNIYDSTGIKKVTVYYASPDGKVKGEVPATYNGDSFSATLTFPKKGDYYVWVGAVDSSNNLTNKDKVLVSVKK